jgi:hypothetical protein
MSSGNGKLQYIGMSGEMGLGLKKSPVRFVPLKCHFLIEVPSST